MIRHKQRITQFSIDDIYAKSYESLLIEAQLHFGLDLLKQFFYENPNQENHTLQITGFGLRISGAFYIRVSYYRDQLFLI